mgnify:CR=1 FL=1
MNTQQAYQAGEVGMQRAADKADRAHPDWTKLARAYLYLHAKKHAEFSGEDAVDAFLEAGYVPPPDQRAFGAMFKKLSREGVISRHPDNKCAPRRKGHGTMTPIWVSNVYGRAGL